MPVSRYPPLMTAYTIRGLTEPSAAVTASPAARTRKINPNILHTRARKRA